MGLPLSGGTSAERRNCSMTSGAREREASAWLSPQGYPRVLCFRGGHCRGRGPPPKGGHPAPTVRLHEGARVLLAVRRLYLTIAAPESGEKEQYGGSPALPGGAPPALFSTSQLRGSSAVVPLVTLSALNHRLSF